MEALRNGGPIRFALSLVMVFAFASEPLPSADLLGPDLTTPKTWASSIEPPRIFRGVYLTSWSAGSKSRVERLIELTKTTAINAVVIDVKDATGYVNFDTDVAAVAHFDAKRPIIRDLASVVEKFHEAGLYVIARVVIFQDPRLALARPDLAVHRRSMLFADDFALSSSTLWLDNRKLAWIDPAAVEAWDYVVAIAEDALSRGVDEINFDYIRFPSDGDLRDMHFPVWDHATPKHEVIREFFAHLRRKLPEARISADLFGLTTINHDDLGVGQVIEDAYEFFDYVCPMVYPSHYPTGFHGYQNPAEYPYEVVHSAMKSARHRLLQVKARQSTRAKLRPWLQDFDLGAIYDARMVTAQIKAVGDALGDEDHGFLMWSPSNSYTTDSLR
jgi:hypothetical protein